jgi:pimeloyl-ACP methyl ester carboxylesterase
VSLSLAETRHHANDRLVLIAPATETRTALDQFFQFLRLDDREVRDEFEKIITRISGYPVSWFSIPRALRKIKAKILWLHDEDDKTTPLRDVHQVRKENHSNIQFVITKGLGHRRIYKDTEVGKRIIEFI